MTNTDTDNSQGYLFPPCPDRVRKFLWWTWKVSTHEFHVIKEWQEPGFYCVYFWTRRECSKCGYTYDDVYEAFAP